MLKKGIGQLRHRLQIVSRTEDSDDFSGNEPTDNENTALWGNIEPLSQYQIVSAQSLNQKVTHKITMRYNTIVKQGCRILDENDKEYYVESVMNKDMRKRFIEIKARISDKS